MTDSRIMAYAELLAGRCLEVRPGDQVVVSAGPLAQPLLDELARVVARRGGYLIPLVRSTAMVRAALEGLPEEQLQAMAPGLEHLLLTCDAYLNVNAPENTRALTSLDPRRLTTAQKAQIKVAERFSADGVRWNTCNYPTQALAQEAEVSLAEYEEMLYAACLIDWDQTTTQMQRIKARFDAAAEVRIVAPGTDLRLSLQGRAGVVDDGRRNMPGGEVFYAPLEIATTGYVTFDYPAIFQGREVEGIRLEFREGRVVDATARKGQDLLLQVLDTDPGARALGELGLGCNYGIQRFTRDILFDEKIGGTIHLAVGRSYAVCGGQNHSAVHWDMVKEMRQGGQIWLDGELVFTDGRYLGL